MYFCDTSNIREHYAKDPCVVRLGDKYFMSYSLWVGIDGKDKLDIGTSVSDDLESWTPVGRLPIGGGCEENGIGAPGAIVLDGVIHMFYQTYGNNERDAICHATSRDGINFEKDPTNPVFAPTADWCCGRAIDADVIEFRGRLYLYFATRDHMMKIQKLGVASADIKSDFSRSAWRQEIAQSVLAPEYKYESACIEAPATIIDDGKIYMFYGGSYNCTPQQIGVAVSHDGVHFDKLMNSPFLPCGEAGSWNSDESGHPYAFRDDDGRAYLFYQGTNNKGKSWYLSKCEIAFRDGMPYIIK